MFWSSFIRSLSLSSLSLSLSLQFGLRTSVERRHSFAALSRWVGHYMFFFICKDLYLCYPLDKGLASDVDIVKAKHEARHGPIQFSRTVVVFCFVVFVVLLLLRSWIILCPPDRHMHMHRGSNTVLASKSAGNLIGYCFEVAWIATSVHNLSYWILLFLGFVLFLSLVLDLFIHCRRSRGWDWRCRSTSQRQHRKPWH